MLGYGLGLRYRGSDWSAAIGDVLKWNMEAIQLHGNCIPYTMLVMIGTFLSTDLALFLECILSYRDM